MSDVRPSSAGIKALLNSTGVRRDLARRGRAVAEVAKAAVPMESGELRRSIVVRSEQHRDRAVVHVVAETPYAAKVLATNTAFAASLDAART